jgi:hypothetical protein
VTLGTTFNWLDGTVRLPVVKPAEWGPGLQLFYDAPNDDRWGGQLSRILYHESIHLWQLLSSAFLANIVQSEWLRLCRFEERGTLEPVDAAVATLNATPDGQPFSALELVECWARYWDVHTRHPGRILREDGIDPPPRLGIAPAGAYTAGEFDTFMQAGRDAAIYARPYRWSLDKAAGNSQFVNLVFPVLVFCAFGSPDPVRVFTTALDRAQTSSTVRAAVRGMSGSINIDWLHTYRRIIDDVVAPAVHDLGLPSFTGGWDVLDRGPLGQHPIFRSYHGRIRLAMNSTQLFNVEPPNDDSINETLRFEEARAAVADPLVLFMFPGQPSYRSHLGQTVPPPRIRFTDTVWYAERTFAASVMDKIGAQGGLDPTGDVTLAVEYEGLDARLHRFQEAKYAARRDLDRA